MIQTKKFFSIQGKDKEYENLRVSIDCQDIRDFIEDMWKEFLPYADSKFLSKARDEDFQAHYWEMYLGYSLLRQNMQIEPRIERESPDEGPDFRILAPYRLWIEAITPSAGTTEDAVPEATLGVARNVPDNEAKLRLLHAIREKAKQRLDFIKKGQIRDTDCYVVAVNTGKFPFLPDIDPPRIVRAVFGLGLPEVSMDVRSRTLFDLRYQPKDKISKKRSSELISSKIFLKREQYKPDHLDYRGYEGLSAVLSSKMTPFSEPLFNHSKFVIGDDYCIVHNLMANKQNQLPIGFLQLGQEYWTNDAGVLNSRLWFNERV